MNARVEIPCRVSADLRAFEAQKSGPTAADYERAREELCFEILDGKTRGGFNLNACLDCEFNSDGYTGTVNDLAKLILNLHEDGLTQPESANAAWLAVNALSQNIVAKHLPEQAVTDRAWAIYHDKAEAAQC